jgi:hypothetical protein
VNKIICTILAALMFCNVAYADCDFSTGVTKLSDGSYKYTTECHLAVGQLVQDNQTKTLQIADLKKAITLKDLALTEADQRTQLWMDTTFKLENNINKIDSYKNTNQWVYFALGALTVIGAGMMAAQVHNMR